MATVFDNAWPFFIILKHNGTIYVCIKKLIASWSLYLTKAPMTPNEVTLKFSNILLLVEVFKNGYKNNGICALRNYVLVCWCNAKHCNNPTTKHILLELVSLRFGGGES